MHTIVNGKKVEMSADEELELKARWKAADEEVIENKRLYGYREDRLKEYPPMSEQLDMIFHRGLASWKASIQAIKDKYPKPE